MPGTTLPAQRTVKNKDKVSALKLLECWQQEADREQGNTGKEEQTGGKPQVRGRATGQGSRTLTSFGPCPS